MTSQSPRIYLYKITFEEVPYYYYGVHKEKYFNDDYCGSPKTNKWCWELYTPKKQILEVFDFTDEGWVRAQEIETRLIKPFFNNDEWCLNESCGGVISLEVKRQIGRNHKENKTGIFSLTPEQRSENGKVYGKKSGKISYEMKVGVHNLTPEQRTANGKRGGSISGKNNRDNKIGIFSYTKEERSNISKKAASQKWKCLETGYVSNAGGLSQYQKARAIDTSKRVRIS
jgi:hypothetical protein